MSARSRLTFERLVAAAFVVATAACADNLVSPNISASDAGVSLDKKTPATPGARAFIDKNGLVTFQVSTTSQWDDPAPQPGQLTHVHFTLCKGWNKDGSTTKQFSANFHYTSPTGVDKEPDNQVDDADDPAYRSDPDRVNWDRSTRFTAIKTGGYTLGFNFTGLKENDLVEVAISYSNPANGPTQHYTLCVPVKKAPDPTLTAGGFLGLSGPDFAFSDKPVTYNVFISDPIGTANVTADCNLFVQAPGATTPTLVGTGTFSLTAAGGGVCSFTYSFPTGGAYVVTGTLTGMLPVDYDVTDNSAAINVNVSGPTGTGDGGGDTGGGGSGPEAVVASFSALGTVQTVMTPNGPTTITAYSDVNTKSTASPAYVVGDDQPSQGVNIKVTLLKLLTGPFTLTANLSTENQSLGHIVVSNLVLSPTNTKKGPGNTAIAPGDICSQVVAVDNPEGYQAQVCTNTISNSTVYYFNAHANFDENSGHFIPYGTTMAFDSDIISGGKHYRIPTQTFALEEASGVMPTCSRYTSGTIMAECYFTENTTIRAGSDAQRSNIIIFGTDD